MTMHDMQSEVADSRINELYWNSDRTIDEIIQENGIGRSTLYASIAPLPLDAACPTCGGTMVFVNRTNRTAGTASCDACGLVTQMKDAEVGVSSSDGRTSVKAVAGRTKDRPRRELSETDWGRLVMIGGAAAAGVIIGAAGIRAGRH